MPSGARSMNLLVTPGGRRSRVGPRGPHGAIIAGPTLIISKSAHVKCFLLKTHPTDQYPGEGHFWAPWAPVVKSRALPFILVRGTSFAHSTAEHGGAGPLEPLSPATSPPPPPK